MGDALGDLQLHGHGGDALVHVDQAREERHVGVLQHLRAQRQVVCSNSPVCLSKGS